MHTPEHKEQLKNPKGSDPSEGLTPTAFYLISYQGILLLAGFLILFIRFLKGKPLPGIKERLGLYPKERQIALKKLKDPVWLHAVSVGEVLAAKPLVEELRRRLPDSDWLITTGTATGRSMTASLASGKSDQLLYLPWDFSPAVRRLLALIRPRLFVCFETELWPVLFHELNARRVPIVVANGRISPKAYAKYLWIRPLMVRVLGNVTLFLIQSVQDARRFMGIGAAKDRLAVTGSVKWDISAAGFHANGSFTRDQLGLPADAFLLTAGSTHPGEEEMVAEAYLKLKPKFPPLRLLIAPRHPERASEIRQKLSRMGLQTVRRSESRRPNAEEILLLDTLGELVKVYAVSDLVFVGGSLVPHGGHNLVEPAAVGKPMVTGSHLQNFQAISETLAGAGALVIVHNLEELVQALDRLIGSPPLRAQLGERALRVIEEHRGAAQRMAQLILTKVQPVS